MSRPGSHYDTPSGFREPSKVKRYLSNLVILTAFLALVIIPLASYGCRAERARWTAAAGLNSIAKGETESGIETIREAVESSGDNAGLTILLADTLTQFGQPESGLALTNAILETDPSTVLALQVKSDSELKLGRPREALATLKSMDPYLDQAQVPRSTRRNNLAYYRALANTELGLARADMRSILAEHYRNNYWSFKFNLSLEAQTIISIAQLSRKLDRQQEGREFLVEKIGEFEQLSYFNDQEMLKVVNLQIEEQFPPSSEWELETTMDFRNQTERANGELAVLLVVRALQEQSAGNERRCDENRLRTTKLGFDPDEIAEFLPPDSFYLNTLQYASTYLDTYGYVQYRLGDYRLAEQNFNLAVLAAEYSLLSLDSPLHNSSTESPKFEHSLVQAGLKKTLATLYYHRMLVYRELAKLDRASTSSTSGEEGELEKADADRIRELGFDPTLPLY